MLVQQPTRPTRFSAQLHKVSHSRSPARSRARCPLPTPAPRASSLGLRGSGGFFASINSDVKITDEPEQLHPRDLYLTFRFFLFRCDFRLADAAYRRRPGVAFLRKRGGGRQLYRRIHRVEHGIGGVDSQLDSGEPNKVFSVTAPAIPFVVPQNNNTAVKVQYQPADYEMDTGTLTIASNDPSSPTTSVALSGTGVCGSISVPAGAPPPPEPCTAPNTISILTVVPPQGIVLGVPASGLSLPVFVASVQYSLSSTATGLIFLLLTDQDGKGIRDGSEVKADNGTNQIAGGFDDCNACCAVSTTLQTLGECPHLSRVRFRCTP